MAKSTILAPPPPPYEPIKLKDALEERYLAYALSTIMGRALPDVRDGLKPVHRRILHAMRELKLDPDGAYKKCARVVGDVIGKFHPHGDQAVYDALVRLAQDFAQRYPLVDGQGNFGNIDGDNAAAYRYTEARLSPTATALLEGIAEELCTALLHLIKHPSATIEKLVEFVPGPDFPTGGVIVEPRSSILDAYK